MKRGLLLIAMATFDATSPSHQPPHRMTCDDGSVYEITNPFSRSSDTLCTRQIIPIQRNLSSSDLKNDPVLMQFYENFTSRMEKMKRMLPESDQWFVYYESVLDGYSYKWLQDNKEQTEQLLEIGVAVASAGGDPPLPPARAPSPVPASSAPVQGKILPTTTKFSLEALQARGADTAGCDKARLHEYLSDADFQRTFSMSSADFAKMPVWKQADAKKKHLLF